MKIMTKDINQCINDILSGEPVHYKMELFSLKSSKELSDHERKVVTQYYYRVRAMVHVAKKRYKYQFDMLLKYGASEFWKADADVLEDEWFSEGLLEIISLIRKKIRELQLELEGLTPGNYGGIQRNLFDIEEYRLYLDYIHDVHDYINAHEWRYDEYLSINVYEYKIHTLDIVNQLKEHGITLEDIIDDINKYKHGFFTIALFWYLGGIKRLIEDHGEISDNALGIILRKWFVDDVKANTIAKYLTYLRNHDNNTLTSYNSGFETTISEIQEKYIKILPV